MGFLTVLNYIAMAIGYFILILILIFSVWMLVDTIKAKQQMRKWGRERDDKKKVEETLAKEKQESAKPVATASNSAAQQTLQNPAQSNAISEASEKEEPKPAENREKLVGENGKLRMAGK